MLCDLSRKNKRQQIEVFRVGKVSQSSPGATEVFAYLLFKLLGMAGTRKTLNWFRMSHLTGQLTNRSIACLLKCEPLWGNRVLANPRRRIKKKKKKSNKKKKKVIFHLRRTYGWKHLGKSWPFLTCSKLSSSQQSVVESSQELTYTTLASQEYVKNCLFVDWHPHACVFLCLPFARLLQPWKVTVLSRP